MSFLLAFLLSVLAFSAAADTDCSPVPSVIESHEWGLLIRGGGAAQFNIAAGETVRMSDYAGYDPSCVVIQVNGTSRAMDIENYSTFIVDMWWGGGRFLYPNNPHIIMESGYIVDWLDVDGGSTVYADGGGFITHLFLEPTTWFITQAHGPGGVVIQNIAEGADEAHLIGEYAFACENGEYDPASGPNFWQGAGWLDGDDPLCQ